MDARALPTPKRLILVRHGNPQVLAAAPAGEWPLTEEGRARSRQLARQLGIVSATAIHTSSEAKAIETARAVGEVLGLPVSVADGLHEHDRRGTPLLAADAFEASVLRFFAAPAECVFGGESADAAAARITRAIDALVASAGCDDVIVVTHGTVMALFLARAADVEPFSLWRTLSMPCAAIVRLPALELDRIVALE